MTKVLSINDLLSPCTDASATSESSRDEATGKQPAYTDNSLKNHDGPIKAPLASSPETEMKKNSPGSRETNGVKNEHTQISPDSCPVSGPLPGIRKRKRVPVSCNTCRHRKIKVSILGMLNRKERTNLYK